MTTTEIKTIISTDCKKYRVKMEDGTSKVVRLWIAQDGCPCIIGKGKRNYGHRLNWWHDETKDWLSLVEVKKNEVDYKKRILKRAKDAHKMLSESGLWSDIKEEIEAFLSLSDEEIDEFVKAATTDFYELVFKPLYEKENKFKWLHTYQVFESFLRDRCWKAPNYNRWWRAEKNLLKERIENKGDYHFKWTEGYDNSVEVKMCDDGKYRGWYSEEYRHYCNGHYYLLFDATHAIFYEHD